jgi:hypothetical protein
MSKRSLPYRRSESEIKKDIQRVYSSMEKELGNINPIFLQKPYSACKRIKKKDKEG